MNFLANTDDKEENHEMRSLLKIMPKDVTKTFFSQNAFFTIE
jgi:hypothetical protein